MRRHARLLLGGVLALAVGCAHAPGLAPDTASRLAGTPGGYLSGEVKGLEDGPLLNNKDFVWALAFAPDSSRVAYTHLGPKFYQLALWTLGPTPALVADRNINAYEFDLEAVAFSADSGLLATAGRDGELRLFEASNAEPKGHVLTEEPLTAVAFHPAGRYIVVGSARGLVSVFTVPQLSFVFEVRAHNNAPVSALTFAADGTLYTGGWDKHVRVWNTREEALRPDQARVHFERRSGFVVLRGAVNGKAQVSFALDARAPAVILNTTAATQAGIDVAFLKDTVTVPTPLGSTVARLAKGQVLRFKSLPVEGVDVAVCDVCVPSGTQGVLGAPFTERFDVVFDESTGEAILTSKAGAVPGAEAQGLVLEPRLDFTFENHVNDVTVDAKGQRLGVALSEGKAERTRAIYEREKKGEVDPKSPANAGALVDAATGKVLQQWAEHGGVVATASISPDGRSLATGGWDKRLLLFTEGDAKVRGEREFGWSVRRVRYSPDGRWVGVAAWTPQNPIGDQESDPAAALYQVLYAAPTVEQR
ncbi:WD40 repeat domain-containing protein [Hyalangium rubrum]|uniref:Aspartyl protease family protein n=1 Tax=Hyalangium rubrum TaxID=3103134 RepID=A0ABU5GXA2_9BACT|nr:aspartyl protease family protein [Hyalangium sp. s54d21]MDY7225818.1 aspartyl protease family protein [Hyalangium sp. s54d21]